MSEKNEPRAAQNTTTDTRCHFAGSARNRARRERLYTPCRVLASRRGTGARLGHSTSTSPFRWGAALEAGAALRGSRLAARAAHVMAPVADVSTVVESMG